MKRLSRAQWLKLKAHLESRIDPRSTLIQTMLETGARVSEIIALSPQDLEGDLIHIKPLKGSEQRRIPLSPNLLVKLRALGSKSKEPFIMALTSSETRSSQRRILHRYVSELTLTLLGVSFGPHALRHTIFSLLYQETKDILLVKQWAGHRSLNSTMQYMHLDLIDRANLAVSALKQVK